MEVKLFVKEDCPRCPAAKRACEGIDHLRIYDVDSIDGLAEASFHGVLATPTIIVVDSSGREVAAWRGVAPEPSELHAVLAN
ncbi:MAG: thioredoxin family protein [Anaerosomatales bacterium]|nr:thioredoxin family protein [Coriobacteriia bacterium]MDI6693053.1 thioredoxin family protein [Anaerosomatales bacterium]